jgi:hypothetical protein
MGEGIEMGSYYFGYCTRVSEECARRFVPTAKTITTGKAAGHLVAFRAAGGTVNRGFCHLYSGAEADRAEALGVIYEHPDEDEDLRFPNYETYRLEVVGDDGRSYDCYTRRLVAPGPPVRLPDGDWSDFLTGMKAWKFPKAYVDRIIAEHNAAAPPRD